MVFKVGRNNYLLKEGINNKMKSKTIHSKSVKAIFLAFIIIISSISTSKC